VRALLGLRHQVAQAMIVNPKTLAAAVSGPQIGFGKLREGREYKKGISLPDIESSISYYD
jgi:hypothetical protein